MHWCCTKYLLAAPEVKHYYSWWGNSAFPFPTIATQKRALFAFPEKSSVPWTTVHNSTEDVDRKTDTTWQKHFGGLDGNLHVALLLNFYSNTGLNKVFLYFFLRTLHIFIPKTIHDV